jgi:hypothetical protein
MNNQFFNVMEFHNIKNVANDDGRFSISTKKWVDKTGAIGIMSKAGRYNSGTYAHIDIALEFASWLSPEFKLYLLQEFKRLKKEEAERNNQLEDWSSYRWLSKINYKLHTDAIKNNIIADNDIHKNNEWKVYSSEADMLNVIVFGIKANEFKKNTKVLIRVKIYEI